MAQFKLFGYTIYKKDELLSPEEKPVLRSFTSPENEDGAREFRVDQMGGSFSYALDLDKSVTNQASLINEYRNTSMIASVDMAISDIVDEAIVVNDGEQPIKIELEGAPISDNTKKIIQEEFDEVLSLLNFPLRAHDIFKRWYIDGQLNYHKMIDENNPNAGIQELRYVDGRNLIKVREAKKEVGSSENAYLALKPTDYNEYWVYNDTGFVAGPTTVTAQTTLTGIKIARDTIAHANSGVIDPSSKLILSHLHKAVRTARQLRMLEDSLVIYRLSRAAERRIFYIDVGHLPKGRAEQYMQSIIAKYKNKVVYDANTGEIRDERKHMAITEDFWLPKFNGQDGTKIDTLRGAENLGIIADVEYFKNNLYDALNVPKSRMNQETMFSIGKSDSTSRDEVKYSRFIDRIRARFAMLFDDILGTQLKLKNIVNEEEWKLIRKNLKYVFASDNHFTELVESEILLNRANLLNTYANYIGKIVSKEWIFKNVMKLDDDEIEEMYAQIQNDMVTENQMLAADYQMKMSMGLVVPDPETGGSIPVHQSTNENEDLNNLWKVLTEETRLRIKAKNSLNESE